VEKSLDFLIQNGFVVLEESEITSLSEQSLPLIETFFNLPIEEKTTLIESKSQLKLKASRGFISKEKLNPTLGYDLKESFDFGISLSDKSLNLLGENKWPNIKGFEIHFQSLLLRYQDLGLHILKLLSEKFNLEKELLNKFEDPISIIRLLSYEKQNINQDYLKSMGAGSHIDYGGLTIVYQYQPGLEVLYENKWIKIPSQPNTLVVFTGFILHKLFNKQIQNSLHRVINRNSIKRNSIAYFLDPNPLAKIKPFDKFCKNGTCFFEECVSGHKGIIESNFQE